MIGHHSKLTRARPSYHCGVAAADELPHLVKDAFTVNAFVEGASLHNDRHRQQDLLANVLLEAAGERVKDKRSAVKERPEKLRVGTSEVN